MAAGLGLDNSVWEARAKDLAEMADASGHVEQLELNLTASNEVVFMCSEHALVQQWIAQNPEEASGIIQSWATQTGASALAKLGELSSSPEALITALDDYGLGYGAPLVEAGISLEKISRELGLGGRYYSKAVNGKTYIIFKGSRSLRTTLKGYRYLASNPKIIDIGIAPKKFFAAAKGSSITLILSVGLNVAKYIADDDASLGGLIAETTTDIAKGAISGVLGAIVGTALIGAGTVAFAPVVAGVAVAFVVGAGLSWLDNHFGITKSLARALDEKIDWIDSWWDSVNYDAARFLQEAEDQILWRAGYRRYRW